MHIAIIGLGEVGRCYARALHAAGHSLSLCAPRPTPAMLEMASSWSLPLHRQAGDWLGSADWVISCVTGASALQALAQCLPFTAAGAVICDMTTASPDVKRQAAAMAAQRSVAYVDVAIMGAVSLKLEKTPLLAAGPEAQAFAALLAPAGGRVRVIEGGAAGDAIALKILRSVLTKGLEALSVELLMAAEQQGVRNKLYEQLSDINETPLRAFIDMLVRTHVVHARRRAHEVHDAAAELASHGLPSLVLPGVEQRFGLTAQALAQHPITAPDPSVEQALQWLLEHTAPT